MEETFKNVEKVDPKRRTKISEKVFNQGSVHR